jgi:hypothetical protein
MTSLRSILIACSFMLACGGTQSTPAPATPATPVAPTPAAAVQCTANPPQFPSFDRTCASDADCVSVSHQHDCCGSTVQLGIAKRDQHAFEAAEKTCAAQFPGCGCAAAPLTADDGQQARADHPIVVACVSGTCRTSVR